MQQFEIILKNEKTKVYYLLSWIVVLVHIIIFLSLAIFSGNNVVKENCIASLILLLFLYIFKKIVKKKEWRPGLHVFFLILMVTWINMYQYWMAAIPVIFDILFSIYVRKLLVTVTTSLISYPSIPAKKIQWCMVNNVILKDGLLTIDFKNNKLIHF